MPVLLVAYELKTPGKDYRPFYEALKGNCKTWSHYLDSVWIVNTRMSADSFAKALYPLMTTQDSLLVIRLAREYQGWLPKEAWDWLNVQEY